MKTTIYVLLSVLSLLGFSCTQDKEVDNGLDIANIPPKASHYIVTSLGDSIPSGVPVPVQGRQIAPDSVARPKTASMRRRPKEVPVKTNIYPAGKPQVIPILKEPKVITIGKDGVPFPTGS